MLASVLSLEEKNRVVVQTTPGYTLTACGGRASDFQVAIMLVGVKVPEGCLWTMKSLSLSL
jgi:hypothetical protein